MKRLMTVLSIFALGTALTVSVALAKPASPHFLYATAARSGNDLVISFKEAGLGSFATLDVTGRADVTVVEACVNGGGNQPTDAKKHSTTHPASTTTTFDVRNGAVEGTVTVSGPTSSSLSCPSGQTATILSVSFTNVSVSGAGITAQIAGTF